MTLSDVCYLGSQKKKYTVNNSEILQLKYIIKLNIYVLK